MSERLPPIVGTFSGKSFHVLEPRLEDVCLLDIAHHLSQICRYTGATSQFWSVGAHCVEVSRRIGERGGDAVAQMQGLIHDASEAYLVDLPRPIKDNEWPNYREIEARIEQVIARYAGVPWPFAPIVKEVDDAMVPDEVANFFPSGSFMWSRYGITRRQYDLGWQPPFIAFQTYQERFYALKDQAVVSLLP